MRANELASWRARFAGWILFTISGIFFVVLAVRDGDWLVAASAVSWLLGCGAFLSADRRPRS